MLAQLFITSRKPMWKRTILLVGVVFVILLVAYLIASSQDYYREKGKDFISLWLAPHLLLEGKDPYNAVDWIPAHDIYGAKWVSDPTFLYPLPLAILLLPIGLLPLEYAAILWVALSIAAILFIFQLILSIWKENWPLPYLIPALVGVFLFRSMAVTLWLGQIDWIILLCLSVGMRQLEKNKWLSGMVVITISIIKPQLGFPLLAFISIWLIFHRIWVALISEGITILGLFSLGWIFDPVWLSEWLKIGSAKIGSLFCCTPTIWGLSSLVCKFNLDCGYKLGIATASILGVLLIFLLIKLPVTESKYVISFSIPITLLVSPYLWTYSQTILILPILIILCILKQRNTHYLLAAPFPLYIALFSSAIVFLSIRIGVDVLSSLVPMIVFGIILGIYHFHGGSNEPVASSNPT